MLYDWIIGDIRDEAAMDVRRITIFWLGALTYVCGDLDSVLNNYDTLHQVSIQHRIIKRDTTTGEPSSRQVEFHSLGKHFNLHLTKKRGVLAKDFRVSMISGKKEREEVDIGNVELYSGYALDEPETSEVHASWEDEDTMMATIQTSDELYVVEPSWRHLPESVNYSMIVYRASDVREDDSHGNHRCGLVNNREAADKGHRDITADIEHDEDIHDRPRRSVSGEEKDTCQLLLVADYPFFKNIGRESVRETSTYLIHLIDWIDTIFRKTDFDGITGMGFEVRQIDIIQDPSHYSHDPHVMKNATKLLQDFKEDYRNRSKFCLAHLFTYRRMENHVLGLANLGSPSSTAFCSGGNIGFTSYRHTDGRPVVFSHAHLVTSHELGHNWGSPHDANYSECLPSGADGGKYLMYTYSVTGHERNNKYFSPCSKRNIGQVLRAPSRTDCFTVRTGTYCGNSRVEEGEECDGGHRGTQGDDPCCDKDCKLRDNAICSDVNHACCDRCQIANTAHQCITESEFSCVANTSCDGISKDCPVPNNKTDGTECFAHGVCRDGECLPFCEKYNMTSCICDDTNYSCQWCCKEDNKSICRPYPLVGNSTGVRYLNLSNGTPCYRGYCTEGVCQKQIARLTHRFWKVIENLTPSEFVKTMRDNIVGTVLIMSLCLWVPSCWAVSRKDEQILKEERAELEWRTGRKNRFVRSGSQCSIRRSCKRYQRMQSRPSQRRQHSVSETIPETQDVQVTV